MIKFCSKQMEKLVKLIEVIKVLDKIKILVHEYII